MQFGQLDLSPKTVRKTHKITEGNYSLVTRENSLLRNADIL